MPANLTPDYLAAEQDYKRASTPREAVEALERMYAALPKHKGTEKMQADIKRRLSEARKESQKKNAGHAPFYYVPHEGAGQVALAGPPNSGKSALVSALTHARPEVAEFPFTTRLPVPGMMPYENVQIQVIDLPAFSREFMDFWVVQVVRNADASVLILDPGDPAVLDHIEFIVSTYDEKHIPAPRLLVATKCDLPGAKENLAALTELYGDRFEYLPVSVTTGENVDRFACAVFNRLGLVRVYTKPPGKKADLGAPYVLHRGQTVHDAARMVHRDFADHLKFARLFHIEGGHDGLMVERTHVVEDQDILELHM
jgi:ribosome-interacting GTPase 1